MADDYDSPWKEILEDYFQDFMAFFFPQAAAEIDWPRGFEFLDKELAQTVQDAELGRRFADKLVKVYLCDGSEEWLLVQIEVQGQREADFPRRMFVYAYRLFDRYAREIASLAVLADASPEWRPSGFEIGRTDAIFAIEESLAMPYVSFVERRGEARGEARGRISGAAWLLRGQIEDRFGPLPEPVLERLDQADTERLTVWGRRVLRARSLEEVFADDAP